MGVTADGFGRAGFEVDPARLLGGNNTIAPEFNALAQPFGVAHFGVKHVLRLAQLDPRATDERTALVIGAGTIGIAVVLSLLHHGMKPASITCVAKHDFQMKTLEELGVRPVRLSDVDVATTFSADLMFEASGSRSGFELGRKAFGSASQSYLALFDKQQQTYAEYLEDFRPALHRVALCRFCGTDDMSEAVGAIVPRLPANFRHSVFSMREFADDWRKITTDPFLGKVFVRSP